MNYSGRIDLLCGAAGLRRKTVTLDPLIALIRFEQNCRSGPEIANHWDEGAIH